MAMRAGPGCAVPTVPLVISGGQVVGHKHNGHRGVPKAVTTSGRFATVGRALGQRGTATECRGEALFGDLWRRLLSHICSLIYFTPQRMHYDNGRIEALVDISMA